MMVFTGLTLVRDNQVGISICWYPFLLSIHLAFSSLILDSFVKITESF